MLPYHLPIIEFKMAELTMDAHRKTFQLITGVLQKNHHTLLVKKELHVEYATAAMHKMGKSIFGYDVGHPWLLYYILNILYLAGGEGHTLDEP